MACKHTYVVVYSRLAPLAYIAIEQHYYTMHALISSAQSTKPRLHPSDPSIHITVVDVTVGCVHE